MAHYMNLYHPDHTPADVTAGFRMVVDLVDASYRLTTLDGTPICHMKDGKLLPKLFRPRKTPQREQAEIDACAMTIVAGKSHTIESETKTEIIFRFE